MSKKNNSKNTQPEWPKRIMILLPSGRRRMAWIGKDGITLNSKTEATAEV